MSGDGRFDWTAFIGWMVTAAVAMFVLWSLMDSMAEVSR